jgi:two-component system response regulator FlrC
MAQQQDFTQQIDDELSDALSLQVGATFADAERVLVLKTLARCNGNRTHAARMLGVSIRTLRNRIKLYAERGIDVPHPGQSLERH